MEPHPASSSAFGMAGGPIGDVVNSSTASGRRRNRTNYRCSKCGQPKRGHVCPYQPRVLRTEGEAPPETRTIGVQVEIDSRLVVRHLQLEAQGLPESYGEAPNQQQQQPPGVDIAPSSADNDMSMTSTAPQDMMSAPLSSSSAAVSPPPPPPEPVPGAPMLFS